MSDETPRTETSVLEADTDAPTAAVIEQPIRSAAGRTFESLAFPDFRWFWLGAMLSNIGTWMQNAAQAVLVAYPLHGGPVQLAIVNFAGGLPVFFLALPAGLLADRMDKRRLLIVCQTIIMLLAFWLAWIVQSGAATLVWVVAIAAATGVVTALNFPAWQAMVPDLVPGETLLNAISLNSAQFQASRSIGPAIAGILMARIGLASAFWANAVSFLAVIWALSVIRPRFVRSSASRSEEVDTIWGRLTGGIRYAREHRTVAVLLTSVAMVTFFGMPYIMLLPLVAKNVLREGPGGVAFLLAINGLGAMVGALGVAYLGRVAHRPTLIKGGMVVFGLTTVAFSFARTYWLSGILLFFAGVAFMTMQSATNTSIQAASEPHVRGRVMALFVMCFMGMMPFGSLAFGALAEVLGPVYGVTRAIAIGAAVCLAWAFLLVAVPRLLKGAEAQPWERATVS